MNVIRNLAGYKMSRDYAMLWELAKTQSVVCVCDYGTIAEHGKTTKCRDVAQTITRDDRTWVSICARGIEYVSAEDAASFVKRCQRENVEFVVPEGVQQV